MKPLSLILLLSLTLLQSRVAATDNCPTVPGCSRSKIEGLWKYAGTPFSYILYKAGNKASEAMGEIFVIIEYDIIWKNGCDHELVVPC